MKEMNKLIEQAHFESTRDALLEHARMGRSVCQSDGKGGIIWIEPAAIFARYGLDEFGRPKA
jgi:hypothetical protein